ncbi:hypothetical protein ABZ614_11490 [Streptomyces sp. NPDC013178]|uniref:DUF6924 domain-containing protein n=1 Tax=Streptomyces sp. NPDC013178 TaxID=3155118 RepID=UPI00340CA28C
MREEHRALVAVRLYDADADEDEDEDQPTGHGEQTDDGARLFRTVPLGVNEVHTNLVLGTMYFEEFAEAAGEDPEGVFRSWW